MADLSTLKTRLSEAEKAEHDLLVGHKETSVSWGDGQSVTYRQANLAGLQKYIQNLKNEIAAKEGKSRRAPISIWPS